MRPKFFAPAAVLAAAGLIVSYPVSWANLFKPNPIKTVQLVSGENALPENALTRGVYQSKDGFALSSSEGGRLILNYPALGPSPATYDFSFWSKDPVRGQVLLIQDNRTIYAKTITHRYNHGRLPPAIDTDKPLSVAFLTEPSPEKYYWFLEIFTLSQAQRDLPLPNVPLGCLAFCFGVLLYRYASWRRIPGPVRLVAFFAPVAAGLFIDVLQPFPFDAVTLGLMFLSVLAAYAYERRGRRQQLPWLWFLAAATLAGFVLRWQELLAVQYLPLQGDAPGFFQLARDLQWSRPLDTGIREPFFVWAARLGLALAPDTDFHFRLITLDLGLALIPMVFFVFRRALGEPTALLAASLMAINPFSAQMACKGLRLEIYTLEILALTWVLLGSPTLRRAMLAGVIAAAICLTRVNSLIAVIPLILFWALRPRRWREGLLTLGVLASAMAPYFWHTHRQWGSPLGQLNAHTAFYRNIEKTGRPSYEGGTVSAFHYLFGERGCWPLIKQTASGYGRIFFNPKNRFNKIFLGVRKSAANWILFPFFLIGLVLSLRRWPQRWYLLICMVFLNGLPFLESYFYEMRLLFHVAPFFAAFTALGLIWAFERLKERRRYA
ncbi:MAG: glycosyltransferase family 39 protein [Elusimicrobia bacterium]|nr:glycosyltransferase family 39 protein [Elusimicrobiota bacterium]